MQQIACSQAVLAEPWQTASCDASTHTTCPSATSYSDKMHAALPESSRSCRTRLLRLLHDTGCSECPEGSHERTAKQSLAANAYLNTSYWMMQLETATQFQLGAVQCKKGSAGVICIAWAIILLHTMTDRSLQAKGCPDQCLATRRHTDLAQHERPRQLHGQRLQLVKRRKEKPTS